MKEFTKRALIFGVLNLILIALLFVFNRKAAMPDYNIVYGTLASLVLAMLYEPYCAIKEDRRPDLEKFGASIFGSIVAGGVAFVILYAAGIII